MADNVIKVSVTSTKSQRVSVSSSQQATNITANSDTGRFWSQNSKNWAVSENIVDNEDYSSKYYANKSKESANTAKGYLESTTAIHNNFASDASSYINELTELKDAGAVEINEAVASGKDEINSTKTTIINDIEFVADGEKKEIEDLIDSGKEELKESIGDVKVLTTLEIGDIGIAPLGIDETKGKRRYLNGQLIIQEQYVQFTDKVKSAVALYPSLACTEEEWQTTATMTVGGQVGKFVVDDNAGTIRLPKIIMPIQGLTDLSKLAEIVEAGLPNIKGTLFNMDDSIGQGSLINGLETVTSADSLAQANAKFTTAGVFDASKLNPIYGNSDTVQQEQIQYPYFIQVATGSETEDNIINEIELNNPFSLGDSKYSPKPLNNLSWLKSEGQYNPKAVYPAYYDWALTNFNNGVEGFALSTGEYTDYDVVINPAEEIFRLPLLDGSESLPSERYIKNIFNAVTTTRQYYTCPTNGFVYIGHFVGANNSLFVLKNDVVVAQEGSGNANNGSVYIPVLQGDIICVYNDTTTSTTGTFYFEYAQGNGSLYYYVGETVQNANLINAGRIEEKLVDCLTRKNKEEIVSWGMPDYSSGISASGLYTSTNKFVAPCDGVLIYFAWCATNSLTLYVNDTPISNGYGSSQGYGSAYPITLFLNKGDTYYQSSATNSRRNSDCAFYPLKGVN